MFLRPLTLTDHHPAGRAESLGRLQTRIVEAGEPAERLAETVRLWIWAEAHGAQANRRLYVRWKSLSATVASATPVAASLSAAPRSLLALFGAIVVAVEAHLHLRRYHELSLAGFRTVNELQNELVLWENRIGAYRPDGQRDEIFVRTVTKIVARADATRIAVMSQSGADPEGGTEVAAGLATGLAGGPTGTPGRRVVPPQPTPA